MKKANALLITAALVSDKDEARFAKCISKYWRRSRGINIVPKDVSSALKRVTCEDILGATTSQEILSLLITPKSEKRLGRLA